MKPKIIYSLAGLLLLGGAPVDLKGSDTPSGGPPNVAPALGMPSPASQSAAPTQATPVVSDEDRRGNPLGADGEPDATAGASIESMSVSSPAGTWVREMGLNDLLQVLARRLGLQYFHNPRLTPIQVTGNLVANVPSLNDIRTMALQYDVLVDANGSSLLAYTRDQLDSLPKSDFVYTLKYLRPDSGFNPVIPVGGGVEQNAQGFASGPALSGEASDGLGANFQSLLRPVLSSTGSVSYEPKTNQLILSDNEYSLARAIEMLDQVDVPKAQVIVQVTILRMNTAAGKFSGVDWAETLGREGLSIGATAVGPLDQIFNTTPVFGSAASLATAAVNTAADAITGNNSGSGTSADGVAGDGATGGTPSTTGAATPVGGGGTNAGIILSPLEVTAVLRFLIENDIAQQEAGPAVITEDNEPAMFRVVERIPIVEQEISPDSGSGSPVIATDVRYRIDPDDPIDPANAREVGVSIAVTPSILPDRTIRMDLLPRVATITRYTRVFLGVGNLFNEYPNVNETTASARARIPDGYTLVLGGYYQDETRTRTNKVPFFGDIPGLSFAFRSDSREKVRSNIVFLITPTTYDPANIERSVEFTEMLRQQYVEEPLDRIPDPEGWPGEDGDSDLGRRLLNLLPWNRPKRIEPSRLAADHPDNSGRSPIVTSQQANQRRLIDRLERRPGNRRPK